MAQTPGRQAPAKQVLICDENAQSRKRIAQALAKAGCQTADTTDPARITDLLRGGWPTAVIMDMKLRATQAIRLVRLALADSERTPPAFVIVTPPDVDPAHVDEFTHAGVRHILPRPITEDTIRQVLASALAEADRGDTVGSGHADAAMADAAPAAPAKPRVCSTNSSLLMRPVQCPFHEEGEPVTFERATLRVSKVRSEMNFFDLPVYTEALPNCDYCNFQLLSIIVCPECFYASCESSRFITPNSDAPSMRYTPRLQQAMAKTLSQRQQLARSISEQFHSAERTVSDAITATMLAMSCSAALYKADPDAVPNEPSVLANHHLRLAHLKSLTGAADERPRPDDPVDPSPEIVDHYRKAYELFQRGFTRVEELVLPRTVYQLTATGIYLGEDQAASTAMHFLREFSGREELDAEVKAACRQYLNRCRSAWDDRDYHRLAAQVA